MELYPAIDLSRGRSVRLVQGDFARETVYGDPLEMAAQLVSAGARRLHVVDLDAARTGEAQNRHLVEAIAETAGVPVQAGGGVRDEESASALLGGGVARVVFGTAAIEDPDLVRRVAERNPGRIAVGLDRWVGDHAVVRGWSDRSATPGTEFLARFEGSSVAAVVVTDVSRDGTLCGPDVEGLAEALGHTSLEVIASGGVGSVDDLLALSRLRVGARSLEGVIVGKALHEGVLSVEDALEACARSV